MLATDGEVKYRWGKQMLSLKQERNDCRGSFRFESNGVAYRPSPDFFYSQIGFSNSENTSSFWYYWRMGTRFRYETEK